MNGKNSNFSLEILKISLSLSVSVKLENGCHSMKIYRPRFFFKILAIIAPSTDNEGREPWTFKLSQFLKYRCVLSIPSPLILIPHGVTSWKHLWVLRQSGTHFFLLFKPPRVRHLNMPPLAGCCLIHDPLQSGVQLRTMHHVLRVGGGSGGGIGNNLCRDFIQNLGLGLFSPQESQLPPAWRGLCHDGWMLRWIDRETKDKKRSLK